MRLNRSLLEPRSGRARPATVRNASLDAALLAGGDARLAVDASWMNPYGAQPFPRPHEISLSSSTASTISSRGYAAAQAAFDRLEAARARGVFHQAFSGMADELRHAIRAAFDLPDADVVLSPSGTDSSLHALFVARALIGRPVTSIVVAADETGNGVAAAASGRHFAPATSSGRAAEKGGPIAGLACAAITIAARDAHGEARKTAEIDREVASAVTSAVRAGNGVVLHAMDHSKLGGTGPSFACLREIQERTSGAVQVVIDACQARLGRARLAAYLDRGFLVQITGSKFFTGPPLSGALLVPGSLAGFVARVTELPDGLADYAARDDWPARFAGIRQRLPERANVGQALRWSAAIEEIHAYFAVPELFRKVALAEFAAAVPRQIERFSELVLLSEPAPGDGEALGEPDEFAARTIFPFLVIRDGRPMPLAQARRLHHALNMDLATPGVGGDTVAATLCHVGQPVALADGAGGTAGALRISADARLVSESWAGAGEPGAMMRLGERIAGVATVFAKLRFLLSRPDRLDVAEAS